MHGCTPPKTLQIDIENTPRASSKVHTLESKWQPAVELDRSSYSVHPEYAVQPATNEETSFRHSGWAPRRKLIWDAFNRLHLNGGVMDRFCNCGSGLWLQRSADGEDLRLSCNTCKNRFCIPCKAAQAARISKSVTAMMKGKVTRFLTLTQRHNNTPLRDQIDRLYRNFLELRRRVFWKSNVKGGVAFLEVKVSEFDGLWHPHLHIIITGRWIDAREISREWLAVTGDSSIVKIKAVKEDAGVAAYVTKYVTKVIDHSVFHTPDKLDECILALRGRRLCFTIGDWRGKELDEVPKDDKVWINVGDLYQLRRSAAENSEEATRWIHAAIRKWPTLEPFLLNSS